MAKPLIPVFVELVALRRELGITQQLLADHLGLTKTLISAWETGRVRINAIDLHRYAQALGCQLILKRPRAKRPKTKPAQ